MIGDRWGVTAAEMSLRYPCDELVPHPAWQAWRGVTIDARAEKVWPWIAQIRLAPYSYDWLDNLGRRSPRELRGLDDPTVGEPFSSTAGRPVGKILAVEPGVHLTARIMGVHMSYLLVGAGEETRLLLKIAAAKGRALGPVFALGDLLMARKQLLNLKALCEGR